MSLFLDSAAPDHQKRSPGRLSGGECFSLVAACLLAGLLAAAPDRGSAIWLHLAAGRAVAQQGLFPPRDPLSYAAPHGPGANWLFDLAVYQVYQLGGEHGVMAAHALLAALLILLIALPGRTGHEIQIFSLFAVLAVLAMAAWITPGPMLVSALLLAVVLFFLDRAEQTGEPVRPAALLPLWLLFLLWACLDSWVVFGLAVVFLRAVGVVVQEGPTSRRSHKLLLALAGSLLAVLLQPRLWHVFELPAQLGLSPAAALRQAPGSSLIVSPLRPDFWTASGQWISSTAWAVLLGAGAFSFVANRRCFDLGRLLVWLAAAGLSLYQARAIPLFAVIAAPTLARNLQETLVGLAPLAAGGRAVVRFLGVVWALAVVLLLVAAWPGWLQPARGPRRLTLAPNPALVHLAGRIDSWRREERLPPGTRIFPTSLESAHHLVWWCPGERDFLDARLDRFDRATAQAFVELRRGLNGDLEAQVGWRDLLRRHGVGVVLLNDSDPERFFAAFRHLYFNSREWDLLALEGNAALFGWRDSGPAPYTIPRLDLERQVIDPSPDRRAPEAPAIPARLTRSLFADFVQAKPIRSPDRDESALYLRLFDEAQADVLAGNRVLWENSLAAGVVGMAREPAPSAAGLDVALRLHLIASFPQVRRTKEGKPIPPAPVEQLAAQMRLGFVACRDQGPAGELLLAVRACRRALAADPSDGRAWFLLGEAYRRLEAAPAEGAALGLTRLRRLRQYQACAAYQEAVRLRPDLAAAHERLAALYGQLGYLDLRLEQLQSVLRLARSGKARTRDPVEHLQGAIDDLTAEVDKRLQAHRTAAGTASILPRAQDALGRGLARRALEVLLAGNIAAFGAPGARLELELLVLTGRSRDALGSLTEELESLMGPDHFHEAALMVHAALGDYALAQRDLGALIAHRCNPVIRRAGLSRNITQALLEYRPAQAGPAQLGLQVAQQGLDAANLARSLGALREEAELDVLRGRLALEQGDTVLARRALGQVCAAADSGVAVPAAGVVRSWYRFLMPGR